MERWRNFRVQNLLAELQINIYHIQEMSEQSVHEVVTEKSLDEMRAKEKII